MLRSPRMRYAEFSPSAALAHVVRCFWTLEGDALELAAAAQPILPDGRPEIIFHLGDPFELIYENGSVQQQPRTIFAGQLTAPLVVRPTGTVAILGIRFRADAMPAFTRVPQHRLAGLPIDLGDLSTPLAQELRNACARPGGPLARIGAVSNCLRRHLDERRLDRHVRAAVTLIRRRRGAGSVDDVARRIGVSRRHLERRFQEVVGISPKRFARIARFQQALRTLEACTSSQRGAATAAACGYADQAHFIRDFGELAGCSPEAHLVRDAVLARLFVEQPSTPNPLR